MTVITLPTGHDYLAAALVRDLGFVRVHVDEPIRRLAVQLDPLVEGGVTLANMGRSPRLSSRLDAHGGDWSLTEQRVPEITRFLDALREHVAPTGTQDGNVVLVGVDSAKHLEYVTLRADDVTTVVVDGRDNWSGYEPDHVVEEGPVVEQEEAIIAFARSLMSGRYTGLVGGALLAEAKASVALDGETQSGELF